MKVYISASIINSPINARIANILGKAGFQVYLPQQFCPDVPHDTYPEAIFNKCVAAMRESDLGLLMLDSYGRDSSWEAGWFRSQNKLMVGLVVSNLRFLQDWMIKGGLSSTITVDAEIFHALNADPILSKRPTILVNNIESLGTDLMKHCAELGKRPGTSPANLEA